MLQEFLVRSLRQSHHEYREEQILKGISRGENTLVRINMAVSLVRTYLYLLFIIFTGKA